jgi:ACS family sodium-dependent inorganic phosphate cotransporter/ACS family sodium-dependent inorganic phosphate cotransporter-like MFS transporter 1/2/3/4
MFGGLYSVACLIFLLTGSSELQSWGNAKDTSKEGETDKSLEKMVA